MEKEIYKDIPNYNGVYQVSNLGNVKSLKLNREKILKKSIDTNGYYRVTLCLKGTQKICKVHKLVAITFLNHKPNGFIEVVDHINTDKTDNRISNLQLITQRENLSKDRQVGYSSRVGVTWHKQNKKWMAQIRRNGKKKFLGYYDCELDAAAAYQNELCSLY
jgi:CRISPR/Cas system CMR-associated protein Cmr3 (group 5 of RAMP superfamily)